MIRGRLRRLLAAVRSDERGATTIEFLIWFPFFMLILLSSIEAGLVALQHSMLERSVDLSVRDLRIGKLIDPKHADIKASVCNRVVVIPDCNANILIELALINRATWTMPSPNATCVDRSLPIALQPVPTFSPGTKNDLILLRACIKIRPFFAMTGLGLALPKDLAGMYALTSASAFVNEPR